jgi:hypothetical protein
MTCSVASSRPDEKNEFFFFSIYLTFPAALGPGVYSVCNITDYQRQIKIFLGCTARSAHEAGNLTAVCEAIMESSTSHNPVGLHGLLWGSFYFCFYLSLLGSTFPPRRLFSL